MTTIATTFAQPEIEHNTRRLAIKNSAITADKSDMSHPSSSEYHNTSDEDLVRRTWSAAELVEVRARERTFDGAYWRTSIGLFGASLIILRVFGLAFFPVGIVFLVLGLGFLAIGLVRRHKLLGCTPFADEPVFVTSGGTVLLSAAMCISAYVVLLVLLPMASRYPPGLVDQVRQQRIRAVRRTAFISIGFQVVFIAIFAALLGYYINRNNNNSSYYYDDNWFKWYIGLLIALLAVDVLLLLYVVWRYMRAVAWLKSPHTTEEQIMLGYNIENGGGVVVMQQMPTYNTQGYQPQQYYQPPPNAHTAQPPLNSQYPPAYGNQQQSTHLYGSYNQNPDAKH
ncbi:hypothetical protein LPJ74_000268 [Coemansia sp. RSA 1843]|nr:hypothetical protein LPJ74_000268 [Coemansia sp. RSA 1843]